MRADGGQAAVEAALTLPLCVFVVLATLQLSFLMQARLLAHYSVAKATRAGALNRGSCAAMADSALANLMPSFYSYTGGAPGPAADKLATAFRQFKLAGYHYRSPQVTGFDGPVFWMRRESPTQAALIARNGAGAVEDENFDDPDLPIVRLEVTLVYWYPMRIPFANWVLSRMMQAHFGLQDYAAQNPLMPTDARPWRSDGASLDGQLAAELTARAAQQQYVFPLPVSYTMRMMTPARLAFFANPYCGPQP